MTRSAPPLIQRADAMFRPRPIGTTVIVCLKLGFPVACLAIRGSDTAAGLTAGVDLHFKLGLGQFLEKRYTSIETFAA